jgi:secreted trypsin-like serine protease
MKLFNFILLAVEISCVFVFSNGSSEGCGKKSNGDIASRIFRGEKVTDGDWPWLVAFVHRSENNFFCAGSLISQAHVLSGLNES